MSVVKLVVTKLVTEATVSPVKIDAHNVDGISDVQIDRTDLRRVDCESAA